MHRWISHATYVSSFVFLGSLFITACSDSKVDSGGRATQLPIDCRDASNTDPICVSSVAVGTGTPLGDGFETGGIVDGNRVIVPAVFGNTMYGLHAINMETKERSVVSGVYKDPRTGEKIVGSGPVFTSLKFITKGPDGYYAFGTDRDHPTPGRWGSPKLPDAFVYRVDPANGNRSIVLDFGEPAAACTTRSGLQVFPMKEAIFSAEERTRLVLTFGADGTMYVPVDGGDDKHRLSGVAAFKDGACHIVSLDDSQDKDDVGSGITLAIRQLELPISALRYSNGALYAMSVEKSLIRIDVNSGNREVISSSESDEMVGTGPGIHRGYMEIAPDGTIWTSGGNMGESMLTAIDPNTGNRTGYYVDLPNQTSHSGGTIFGFDPSKPFIFIEDRGVVVLEYSTGNGNVLAREH